MAYDGIHVGLNPKPITFHYVLGYPLVFSLTYRVNGVATAWPATPSMFFGDPESENADETLLKVATLSPASVVTDARATFTFSALEIATVDELPDASASVLVGAMPWWTGQAVRHG